MRTASGSGAIAARRPVYARNVSAKGVAFVGGWEGCVLHPYNDAAEPPNATIGFGHELHPGPVTAADLARYRVFTRAQALELLRHDLAGAVAAVNALGLHLAQHELDALASFAFNCGGGALTGGIARNLRAGNKVAAMDVLCEFVHAGATVLPGLVRRRQAERALFLHGTY